MRRFHPVEYLKEVRKKSQPVISLETQNNGKKLEESTSSKIFKDPSTNKEFVFKTVWCDA